MNIVVGYLETAEGRAAIDRATAIARDQVARLNVVGVVESPRTDEDAPEYASKLETARERLEEWVATLEDVDARAHVPAGIQRPSTAILSTARSVRADLIVIGMRRRSRVGKLVLGSTAQEVLIDAECDVLSVKAALPK